MVDIEYCCRICELIARKLSSGLGPDEEQELQEWQEESEKNQKLFDKIREPNYLSVQEKKRNSIDVRKYWKQIDKELRGRTNNNLFRQYWSYAAVVLLLLGIGVAGWWMKQGPAEVLVQTEQIQPGVSKAFLVLADGKTVELGGTNYKEQRLDFDGTVITDDAGG